MGIKGLKTFLKKTYPKIFNECYYDTFSGKKIAIDIIGLVFSYKACTHDWLYMLREFLMHKTRLNIELVIVFEGKAPKEKNQEKQARIHRRQMLRDEITQLKCDVEQIQKSGEMSPLVEHILNKVSKPKRLSKAVLCKLIGDIDGFEHDVVEERPALVSTSSVVETLNNYIRKVERQSISLTGDDMNEVWKMCAQIPKVKLVEAPGEAEQLCAWLCVNGHVDAVLSEDSDLIALQCPIILTKSATAGMVSVFNYEAMLRETKLSRAQVIDWAVLCGTDYNISLPRIAAVRALEIIRTYNSIDNFLANGQAIITKYNITQEAIDQLNYETVRQMYNISCLDGIAY